MDVQSNAFLNPDLFRNLSTSKKVMLIDDDEDFRTTLREFLEEEDWQVEDHQNVQEALKRLKLSSDYPDIILLDYLMPLENGIYFWNVLNDDRDLCHIPTVMITAHDMNSINAIGIRSVVKKPVETEHLLTIMNTLRNEKLLEIPNHTILN